MDVKRSKCPYVAYIITKGYVRARGYGDEQAIIFSRIPEMVEDWEEPMKSEMMGFYEAKFPILPCPVCGTKFRKNGTQVTCRPECSYKRATSRTNERSREKVECDCSVCGKTFTKIRHQQKYVCSIECSKEYTQTIIGNTGRGKKKKKVSQIVKIEKEARAKGLYYADIQKQKTLAMVGGVKL